MGNSPLDENFLSEVFYSFLLLLFWWLFRVQSLIMVERCKLFDRDNLDNLIAARFDENLIKLISVSLSVKWLPFSSTYLFHRVINALKHNNIIFLCFHTRNCLYSIYPHDVNIPMCTSSKVCNLIFFSRKLLSDL